MVWSWAETGLGLFREGRAMEHGFRKGLQPAAPYTLVCVDDAVRAPLPSKKVKQIRNLWSGNVLNVVSYNKKIIVLFVAQFLSMLFSVEVYNQRKIVCFILFTERKRPHRTLNGIQPQARAEHPAWEASFRPHRCWAVTHQVSLASSLTFHGRFLVAQKMNLHLSMTVFFLTRSVTFLNPHSM